MDFVVFIGFNIMMMSVFFVVGIYQFMRIEDKRKHLPAQRLRGKMIVSELDVDEAELRQLVRDEQYDTAIQHLIEYGDVDRFTAEIAIESLKQQEYRPYHSSDE